MKQILTIQQAASIAGLSVHTLRYYEKIGLLNKVSRTENGYRSYSEQDMAWIDFLNRLRVTGMPIRTMEKFAALRRKGEASVRERRELLEQHETNIQAHMAELEESLRKIQEKIALYREMEEKTHDAQG